MTHVLVLSFGDQVSHEFDDRTGNSKSFKPDWNTERKILNTFKNACFITILGRLGRYKGFIAILNAYAKASHIEQ